MGTAYHKSCAAKGRAKKNHETLSVSWANSAVCGKAGFLRHLMTGVMTRACGQAVTMHKCLRIKDTNRLRAALFAFAAETHTDLRGCSRLIRSRCSDNRSRLCSSAC